jgi:hypothetical protein
MTPNLDAELAAEGGQFAAGVGHDISAVPQRGLALHHVQRIAHKGKLVVLVV